MKKIFIPIFILLAMFLSGCTNNKKVQTPAPKVQQQLEVKETKTAPEKTNIETLLNSNKSLKCKFSEVDKTNNAESVLYISNKKIRINGKTEIKTDTASGTEIAEISVVILDNEMYSWGYDKTKTGMKIKLNSENSNFNDVLKEEGQYDCSDWTADEKLFEIPKDIKFQDLTDVMNGVKK